METLIEIGLLSRNEKGEILAVNEWMMPDEGTLDVVLLKSHESMLTQAKEAVSTFPREHRIALGFTGSLPRNRIAELEEKMVQTFSEMASNCESDPREVVVQMNFVMFPLSDPGGTV